MLGNRDHVEQYHHKWQVGINISAGLQERNNSAFFEVPKRVFLADVDNIYVELQLTFFPFEFMKFEGIIQNYTEFDRVVEKLKLMC